MALPLERTIMVEIGLENHYTWYNGSGSCGIIRCKAVELLPQVIQRHADAGEHIVGPDLALMKLAVRIAGSPYVNETTLTDVWQTCSYIIAQHITAMGMSLELQEEKFQELAEYLEQKYLAREPSALGRLIG